MPNRWMEEEIRYAQQKVDKSEMRKGSGPFPVYRPSIEDIVWVPSVDDVVFVALAEQSITKAKTLIEEDDRFSGLGPIRRMFYKGRGKQ